MNTAPTVYVVHELPGRVRYRLSTPARDWADLAAQVLGHEGLEEVQTTPVSRSVLVRFDPDVVAREEIGFRLALAYSLDQGGGPVRLFTRKSAGEMTDSAFYSGVLLLVSLAARLSRQTSPTSQLLDTLAGVGTAGAVIAHGWQEAKRDGAVDPEVFSVVYLLIAMLRSGGAAVPAAAFTWLTTFARHLIQAPTAGVEIKPASICTENNSGLPSEVVVSPVVPASGATLALRLISSGLRYAVTGGAAGGTGALVQELTELTKHHGEVLEGLGDLRQGIPVRVQP